MLLGPIHNAVGEVGVLLLMWLGASIAGYWYGHRSSFTEYKAKFVAQIEEEKRRLLERKQRLAESVSRRRKELEETHNYKMDRLLSLQAKLRDSGLRLNKAIEVQTALYEKHINYPQRVPDMAVYDEELRHYQKLVETPPGARMPILHTLLTVRSALRLNGIRKRRAAK